MCLGGAGSIIGQVNRKRKKTNQNKTKTALNIHIMHESSHCYDVKFTWVPSFAKGGVVLSGKVVTWVELALLHNLHVPKGDECFDCVVIKCSLVAWATAGLQATVSQPDNGQFRLIFG